MSVGFLFPGQGSQYVGMGQALYEEYASVKAVYDEAQKVLGWDVAALCFEGPESKLNQTQYTQPALLTTSIATWRAMGSPIHAASAFAGHSLGEYTALVAAGALSFADAVHIVHLRGRFMQDAVPEGKGAMAAIIGLKREAVDAICAEVSAHSGVVSAANYNGPIQVVIAGAIKAVENAMATALEKGAKRAIRLAVSVPSHCSLMQSASVKLKAELDKIEGHDFKIPLINNLAADKITTWQAAKAGLVEQVSCPLLWEEIIAVMLKDKPELFFEVGPGKVLAGLQKRIDRRSKLVNVEDPSGVMSSLAILVG